MTIKDKAIDSLHSDIIFSEILHNRRITGIHSTFKPSPRKILILNINDNNVNMCKKEKKVKKFLPMMSNHTVESSNPCGSDRNEVTNVDQVIRDFSSRDFVLPSMDEYFYLKLSQLSPFLQSTTSLNTTNKQDTMTAPTEHQFSTNEKEDDDLSRSKSVTMTKVSSEYLSNNSTSSCNTFSTSRSNSTQYTYDSNLTIKLSQLLDKSSLRLPNITPSPIIHQVSYERVPLLTLCSTSTQKLADIKSIDPMKSFSDLDERNISNSTYSSISLDIRNFPTSLLNQNSYIHTKVTNNILELLESNDRMIDSDLVISIEVKNVLEFMKNTVHSQMERKLSSSNIQSFSTLFQVKSMTNQLKVNGFEGNRKTDTFVIQNPVICQDFIDMDTWKRKKDDFLTHRKNRFDIPHIPPQSIIQRNLSTNPLAKFRTLRESVSSNVSNEDSDW